VAVLDVVNRAILHVIVQKAVAEVEDRVVAVATDDVIRVRDHHQISIFLGELSICKSKDFFSYKNLHKLVIIVFLVSICFFLNNFLLQINFCSLFVLDLFSARDNWLLILIFFVDTC
jgi:hypothetical protein